MKKAALHNLGCKVNSYETEAMAGLLQKAGYEIVEFDQMADVYVINTCSVTNIAEKKSRQMIHRAKQKNPKAIVVAAGCYVQVAKDQARISDNLDIIVGNDRKENIVQLIEEFIEKNKAFFEENDVAENQDTINSVVDVIDINKGHDYENLRMDEPTDHTRVFLKVQDGCNQFCSYCIIPYARGRVRSRAFDDVIEECKRLAVKGYKEIVLTGIHLSSYGVDNDSSLLELIKAVAQAEGIERIRLGSLEPRIITDEFASEISKIDKVCPHFHLSLQSGSDTVLKRMNRHYTSAEYLEKCGILRKYFEHPAITTDIIVGFPGETDEEFQESVSFAKEVGFYEIHVFKYSPKSGTVAAKMADQVSGAVKNERSDVLMAVADELKNTFEAYYDGKILPVLFEEKIAVDGKSLFTGFSKEYVKVYVNASDFEHEEILNNILEVEYCHHLV